MTPERWQQITDTLQAALARPTEQQAGFPDSCSGDTSLRLEVEAMARPSASDKGWCYFARQSGLAPPFLRRKST